MKKRILTYCGICWFLEAVIAPLTDLQSKAAGGTSFEFWGRGERINSPSGKMFFSSLQVWWETGSERPQSKTEGGKILASASVWQEDGRAWQMHQRLKEKERERENVCVCKRKEERKSTIQQQHYRHRQRNKYRHQLDFSSFLKTPQLSFPPQPQELR